MDEIITHLNRKGDWKKDSIRINKTSIASINIILYIIVRIEARKNKKNSSTTFNINHTCYSIVHFQFVISPELSPKHQPIMSSYFTAGANKFKKVREWATPTLKSSAFLERGVLTPEEFVMAGDELVYKCPTWQWESGDPKKAKNFLPSDKQVSTRKWRVGNSYLPPWRF